MKPILKNQRKIKSSNKEIYDGDEDQENIE